MDWKHAAGAIVVLGLALAIASAGGVFETGDPDTPAVSVTGADGTETVPDRGPTATPTPSSDGHSSESNATRSVETFESSEAFESYLLRSEQSVDGTGIDVLGAAFSEPRRRATPRPGSTPTPARSTPTAVPEETAAPASTATPMPAFDTATPERAAAGGKQEDDSTRVSKTNVQVQGIDEPAILKTAPRRIYFSRRTGGSGAPIAVLNTSQPAAPSLQATIDREEAGRLLLVNETLIVLEDDRVTALDVSDPGNPERRWAQSVAGRIRTARLHGGELFLVTRESIDRDRPCPVRPLEGASKIPCSAVSHPTRPIGEPVTYSASVVDPHSGVVESAQSFVGHAGASTVYMSRDALYVTYPNRTPPAELVFGYLASPQAPDLSDDTEARLETVRGYNLSQRATLAEVEATLDRWIGAGSGGESDRRRRQLRRGWNRYLTANRRTVDRTEIVEIGIDSGIGGESDEEPTALSVRSTGSVPGQLLDQFSMSEHDAHLRVATTITAGPGARENDVYVLDENLERVGAVTAMGERERIFSVRFVGDTGYVVTFRRIDPFHVLDLSDPDDPTLEGELKLPGFSSYLHPLGPDRILGIGEEDGAVKTVVFDVDDPTNPTVEDDHVLERESWSAVSETHHAFLLDRKHGVFFLPGRNAGYVFDYEDGLGIETRIETPDPARRAAYVDDYLYVFTDDQAIVVNETDWNRTTTVSLSADTPNTHDE
jgi:uncharacterized secreted protein with C-terminal beta-propeller domain